MSDLRPQLDPIFSALGSAAVVTVPAGVPIATRVIRNARGLVFPAGDNLTVNELRRTLALRRDEVPVLPSGTTIVIGADTFTVDSVVQQDDEVAEVLVR